MFQSEKIYGVLIAVILTSVGGYFIISKLQQEIFNTNPSPSPSALNIDFLAGVTPAPLFSEDKQIIPQPSELPLAKNKRLAKFPGILKPEVLQNKVAIIETAKGKIALQVYPEATQAASNFLILASNGFYDGLTFHRVEKDFVVQGGDPAGDGTGGPGYTFADEPVIGEYKKGIVAMANAGPNTNGSQFFIMLSDRLDLPKIYTIFGKVISGMDVVEKISVGDIMQKVIIQNLK